MLSRWFSRSSRLTHPDRDKRLQAVQALSPEQAKDCEATLLEMVHSDGDTEVRAAAFKQIQSADTLAQLLEDSRCAEAAAAQIAARIASGETCPAEDHTLVIDARIRLAQPQHIEALLPLLGTAEQCAELALRVRDEARRTVLQHPLLNREEGLSVLQRLARGKDKNCHRHAKERLDQIKSCRQRCSEVAQRLTELDDAIDKALSSEPNEHHALLSHRQRLLKLKDMREHTAAELTQAAAQLASAGADANAFKAAPDPFAGRDVSLPEPAEDPFPPLAAGFERLAAAMRSGAALEDISRQRDSLTTQWLSNADHFPPSAAQHQLFEEVSKQFKAFQAAWQRLHDAVGWQQSLPELLPEPCQLGEDTHTQLQVRQRWRKRWRRALHDLRWPEDHMAPAEVSAAVSALTRIETEVDQLEALLKEAEQQLGEHIRQTGDLLEQGQLEPAKQSLRKARSLQQAGVRSRERELAALSAQVAEFSDWQQFATNPKRAELLAQLQSLAEAPEEPATQATRLKHLRAQWQQLGKPNSATEFEQQRQFDEWAERAFEPCRDHYAEQAEVRAANLAQREALCEQLQQYLADTDWDKADMQAAESIMRSARQEWQQHHPCDRRALKPVQARFETLQNELHGKVKAAWDANVARKQAIVEEAKTLLQADLNQQIEGAKALQQRWREVGKTPRGPDQRLWREFRTVCDQIFAQRDADQQQRKAELDAQYQALEDAITALEAAIQHPQPSRKSLDTLTAAIEQAAADLRLNKDARQRIDAARSSYQEQLLAHARQQAEADLLNWRDWDAAVAAAETAAPQERKLTPPHPMFAARLDGTATPADWLQLVLEAEIAADLPSPAADQAARMALQVDLMNAGRRDLASEDYRDLLRRWCEAGPKDKDVDHLRERFFSALKRRL